jgi:excisionase family DNA binding protein
MSDESTNEKHTEAEPVAGQLLYSVPQGARVVSLSKRSMWACIQRGEIKIRRFGTRVLIHRQELERFAKRDHDGAQG